MFATLKERFKLPTSRLSRRIVWWVFISVIIIETIIFVPSYKNRRKELLSQIKKASQSEVLLIAQLSKPNTSEEEILQKITVLLQHHSIIGGILYNTADTEVGFFGERPELPVAVVRQAKTTDRLSQDKSRYDIAASFVRPSGNYTLILRHDSVFVKNQLVKFFIRISGLVLIISLFVTIGAWLTLKPLVVTPVLMLRKDLAEAGDAISNDRPEPEFISDSVEHRDELGDVITAFRQMYRQISDAVNERRQAEDILQKSFEQLNTYSKALNSELKNGRQIQKNFLPDRLPQIPGWETASFFKPARQVSGDFYDMFLLPGNCAGIVVADVCDKGVGAALFMALFRSLIRIFSGQALPKEITVEDICKLNGTSCPSGAELPAANPFHINALQAVRLTNDYIAVHHGSLAMFATLFFGVLDPETGILTYISGGHDPVFVINAEGRIKSHLKATGPAVGIQAKIHFEMKQICLEPGDVLLGYTDGVPEASDEKGQFFTTNRLISLLNTPVSSARLLIERIVKSVTAHTGHGEQSDDITLLALRRVP